MNKQYAYTEDTIVTYTGLEAVRRTLNQYLPDNSPAGFKHLVWEYVTNSVDEFVAQGTHGNVTLMLCCHPTSGRVQIIVHDDGRGIPSKKLRDAYTKLNTTGKNNKNSAYFSSAGQFGVGGKVGCAIARTFKAITHNYLEKDAGVLKVTDGKDIKNYNENGRNIPQGVLLAFEPDFSFFVDCQGYAQEHYKDLVDFSADLSVFNENVDFKVYRVEHLLPEEFWDADAKTAYDIYHTYANDNLPTYDTVNIPDRTNRLFAEWEMINTPSLSDKIVDSLVTDNIRLGFTAYLYLCKKSRTVNPQYFIMVNNVRMYDYAQDSVNNVFLHVLREKLANYIEDQQLREYVASDSGYRFPTMMLAVGVFYNGARHGGTTKSTFKNREFERIFTKELTKVLNTKGDEYWQQMAAVLKDDILQQYSLFYNVPVKKADVKKAFVNLNFPANYFECSETDNTKTELYIVEGSSAANIIKTRDARYQAVYTTRGKPYNPATRMDNTSADKRKLLKDPIYHDIMTIIGITPQTTDIATCRFSKIVIATDADPDGYHIGALHVHDLKLLNPLIVESGLVWVANPPLYSMSVGKNNLFLRDMPALMDARIEFIYKPALDFTIVMERPNGQLNEIVPSEELYREVGYLMNYLGEQFEIVADQLNIPLLILERLVYAVKSLYPVIRYDELPEYFKSLEGDDLVMVTCNPENQSLVVSIGRHDYTIGLQDVGELIKNQLLANVKHFQYNRCFFKVRGKLKSTEITEPTLVSPMQFYTLLKGLNNITKVMRYKGLGRMPTQSCFATLMDPTTRSLTHITGIGSESMDYDLVGNDSTARKQLMASNGYLSSAFQRANELLQAEWDEIQ